MQRIGGLNLRAVIPPAILSLFVLFFPACGDDARAPLSTVTGAVTESAARGPDESCTGEEFEDSEELEANITETSASITGDLGPEQTEVFEFGDHALYVPASVDAPRALLIALGGPDTRAFVTGKIFGAPFPDVEASLHLLGQEFRDLAASKGLAILGTRRALPNGPDSDQLLLNAVRTAAEMSGRSGLPTVPMILYGMSGGAPQASGFAARNPERVAGLFLKVPVRVASLTSGNALRVPTYMVLAELDVFVDNAARTADFETNRRAGALWALVMERAVVHHSLTPIQRQVTITWMRTVLKRRLAPCPSHPLREIAETSGWLGDHATGTAWRWAAYPADRALASWLPSRATAKQWEDFIAVPQ